MARLSKSMNMRHRTFPAIVIVGIGWHHNFAGPGPRAVSLFEDIKTAVAAPIVAIADLDCAIVDKAAALHAVFGFRLWMRWPHFQPGSRAGAGSVKLMIEGRSGAKTYLGRKTASHIKLVAVERIRDLLKLCGRVYITGA